MRELGIVLFFIGSLLMMLIFVIALGNFDGAAFGDINGAKKLAAAVIIYSTQLILLSSALMVCGAVLLSSSAPYIKEVHKLLWLHTFGATDKLIVDLLSSKSHLFIKEVDIKPDQKYKLAGVTINGREFKRIKLSALNRHGRPQ